MTWDAGLLLLAERVTRSGEIVRIAAMLFAKARSLRLLQQPRHPWILLQIHPH